MNRTLTNAIFAVVLAASAAGLATHAVADDQSGVNHYILCDKNVGCASGVGGTATPAAYRIEGLYSNLADGSSSSSFGRTRRTAKSLRWQAR